MLRRSLTVACCILAAALTACGAADDTGGGTSGMRIVATTSQVGDLARAVAGDRAGVRQVLQPNADPHEYEPRPSDVRAISEADVVLRSGGDVDDWLSGILRNAGSGARVVTLIDRVRTRRGPGGVDPHWWQDPRNALAATRAIRDALIAADPGGRAEYTANEAAYAAQIRALARRIETCMRTIPQARRKLVTDHDALGYFADRYGIDVVGTVIPALSTQAQASAGEVARLVRTIRANAVSTIFPQNSVSAKLTRAIADDAGAQVGPALYADTLGPKGSAGETYLGALRFNARAVAAGFTGGRPPAPCQL